MVYRPFPYTIGRRLPECATPPRPKHRNRFSTVRGVLQRGFPDDTEYPLTSTCSKSKSYSIDLVHRSVTMLVFSHTLVAKRLNCHGESFLISLFSSPYTLLANMVGFGFCWHFCLNPLFFLLFPGLSKVYPDIHQVSVKGVNHETPYSGSEDWFRR